MEHGSSADEVLWILLMLATMNSELFQRCIQVFVSWVEEERKKNKDKSSNAVVIKRKALTW